MAPYIDVQEPLRIRPEEYGKDLFRQHLLEQYKLYVDSAHRVTDGRRSASNYLLSVNTALVMFYGLTLTTQSVRVWRWTIVSAGFIVAISWLFLILAHRRMNSAKFTVIRELECQLPAAVFDREYALLKQKGYRRLSSLEAWIPTVFIVVYAVLLILL